MSTFETAPSGEARKALLATSKDAADEGELVGRDPRQVPSEILSLYYGERNPLKAIRLRCLDCCCGQPTEVRKCTAVMCPSWPFRMGVNSFREKRKLSEEQRQAMAKRLQEARRLQ